MANYPQEPAQDAVCQSHTGHINELWFLPTRPLRLNTNEWMNEYYFMDHTILFMIHTVQSPQLYILWPEDGLVQRPKHVVSWYKVNNIRQLCFDSKDALFNCE